MMDSPLFLALMAGLAIPMGAGMATWRGLRHFCLERELDSFVTYLGGGALLAALALVLVPEGMTLLPSWAAGLSFMVGGLVFWRFSIHQKNGSGGFAVFMGMLLDYFPESLALGAAAATGAGSALLLTLLIFIQNMPQGFSAYTELRHGGGDSPRPWLWPAFLLAPLVGPAAAWFGFSLLSGHPQALGVILLFCSGGILYLLLDEIAPGAHLKNHHFPTLGSVLGFVLGLLGAMWTN